MEKTLVVVHVEPDFKNFIPENLPSKILTYSKLFDSCLVVESASELSGTQPYYELESLYDRCVKTWVWGWPNFLDDEGAEPDEYFIEGEDYIVCRESNHAGAYIAQWMRELSKDRKYYLTGGCRTECLQDVIEIFQHLELNFVVVESLTFNFN